MDETPNDDQAGTEHGETTHAEESEDGVKTVMSDFIRQFNDHIDEAVDQ